MMGCNKCVKVSGLIFVVLGIFFLLVDLGIWSFWNINWWTAVFLILGICSFAMSKCPDCMALRQVKEVKKK